MQNRRDVFKHAWTNCELLPALTAGVIFFKLFMNNMGISFSTNDQLKRCSVRSTTLNL